MSQRKIWKAQEDQILKDLFEERRIKKWSEISRIMEKNYGIEGRNGKQCRERYHNHLKGGIKKEKWTEQEEQRLVELHACHGNRWALISKLIQGRTENCVKNMLYSKMRKAIRQLNRFSYEHYRKTLKEIKISFIYRLIEFTENSYRRTESERNEQEITALRIKNEILKLNLDDGRQIQESEKVHIKGLVEDIHLFKRVNQRFRGGHSKLPKRGKTVKKIEEEIEEEEEENSYKIKEQFSEEEEDESEAEMAEKRVEVAGKQSQSSVKTKQQHKQVGTSIPQLPSKEQNTLSLVEGISCGRKKISILRMDSLDSNISSLLVDVGLENPIRTEHQFINLTPTPRHTGVMEDWSVLSSNWRNNFVFE